MTNKKVPLRGTGISRDASGKFAGTLTRRLSLQVSGCLLKTILWINNPPRTYYLLVAVVLGSLALMEV